MEDKCVCAWGWREVMVSVFTIVKGKAIDILRAVEKQTLKHTSELLLLLSHFSRVRLCDPIDSSPPGSPIPGILQARTLEWVAISFSNA